MATTATRQPQADIKLSNGFLVTVVDLSTITPDEPVDASHGGPSGVAPVMVSYEVRTRATNGSPVVAVNHESASDSTSNNTARVRVSSIPGGDLSGAVVRVFFHFVAQASGGIS